jgi:hypothetical protein
LAKNIIDVQNGKYKYVDLRIPNKIFYKEIERHSNYREHPREFQRMVHNRSEDQIADDAYVTTAAKLRLKSVTQRVSDSSPHREHPKVVPREPAFSPHESPPIAPHTAPSRR